MTKIFTKDDLIRFVYDEINENERFDIRESLKSDMNLRSSLEQINEARSLLDSFLLKAPKDTISRILYASKIFSLPNFGQ